MENNSTSDVFDPKTFINEDFYLVNELSDENIQALHNYLKPTFIKNERRSKYDEHNLGYYLDPRILDIYTLENSEDNYYKAANHLVFLYEVEDNKYWLDVKDYYNNIEYVENIANVNTNALFELYYSVIQKYSTSLFTIDTDNKFTLNKYTFSAYNLSLADLNNIIRECLFFTTFYKNAVCIHASKLLEDKQYNTDENADNLFVSEASIKYVMEYLTNNSENNHLDDIRSELLNQCSKILIPKEQLESLSNMIFKKTDLNDNSAENIDINNIDEKSIVKLVKNMQQLKELREKNPNITPEEIYNSLYK